VVLFLDNTVISLLSPKLIRVSIPVSIKLYHGSNTGDVRAPFKVGTSHVLCGDVNMRGLIKGTCFKTGSQEHFP